MARRENKLKAKEMIPAVKGFKAGLSDKLQTSAAFLQALTEF